MLSLIILYSGNTYAAKKVKNIQSYVWVKDKIVIGKGNRASLKQYGFYTVYSKKNKLESSNPKSLNLTLLPMILCVPTKIFIFPSASSFTILETSFALRARLK